MFEQVQIAQYKRRTGNSLPLLSPHKGMTEGSLQRCRYRNCSKGIGERYGAEPEIPETTAKGDDICHLIYHKK